MRCIAYLLVAGVAVKGFELPQGLTRRAVCTGAALVASRWMAPATADQGEEAALRAKLELLQRRLDELSTPAVDPSQPIQDIAVAGSTDMAGAASVTATETATAPSIDVPVSSPPAPAGPSAFDFDVPFRGEPRDIAPFLGKKASIFINVKFADPISIDQMPAISALADKYASQGVNVLAFPTDQGWFEEDDSNSLRLKFKQTFDFGRYPTSVVFDKADLLGTNAQPLFAWLTKAFPNPWGVERVVLNYEKWLIGSDGRPLRRYPRKYPVNFMEADLQAIIAGDPLPPPSQKWLKAWEDAKREAIKSEYAFKPGLNYYTKGSPAS